ncbi:IS5 family transposase [Victivallis vadensis]|uniref:IS5 family transposase n=1 Tax=Victivallis vadensis TaxID=172901 RepID=UPI0023EFC2FE|nr:IS5 family transposase [Victivallis vadensis]
MANAYERHDISDESWAKIEFLLPGRKGTWGGNARDNRQFINAVFWILRTGAPWRDLPPSYGDWKNTHRRFCRWRDKGVWENLLVELIDNPEFELLMIDASHGKVHAHGSGARGGNQDMAKNKRGLNTKIHLAVDAHGMPVRILITEGTTADCKQAEALIDNIKAKVLLADRGYDSDAIVEKAEKAGMKAVIPPRKNRKIQREYDKELYKLRHFVENAFMILKRWRGVATRYAKNTASFLAAVQIRCTAAWVF